MSRTSFFTVIGLALCIIGSAATMSAGQHEKSDLRDRVGQLEWEVRELKRRVADLEKRGRPIESVPASRAAWRELRGGMTVDQVRRLLGEPRKVDANTSSTYWRYSTQIWHSSVTFDTRRMTVDGWDEPE